MPANGNDTKKIVRLISWKELKGRVPYTRTHLLRLEGKGKFPRRVRVGENRVGWVEDEVEQWALARMAERTPKEAAE